MTRLPARLRARRLVALGALIAALPSTAAAQSARSERSPDGDAIGQRIARGLRPVVRVVGAADTAFDVRDRMRHWHVPGVGIAVIDDFRVVWAQGFGVRAVDDPTPVDTTTRFQAGSISKPVFATAALALVQQGRLDLDEDVNARLRRWRLPASPYTATEKVTLRRILSHTAGLTVWGFPGYAAGAPVPTLPQLLDGVAPANTPAVRSDTVPGARWRYSGGGITIAQLMVEDVTGEPFPALVQRLVLGPLGMAHSTYEQPLPAALARTAASGHERLDTVVAGRFHTYPEMAAAGLWTTPADLARWAIAVARAYRGTTGGPLSPATARQMLAPAVTLPPDFASPDAATWGLGVALAGEGDAFRFSHGGRDEGFVATLVMWPARGQGIVVMTNGVSGALIAEITRGFAAELGLPAAPRIEKRVATGGPSGPDTLLLGRYRAVVGKDTVIYDVRLRGGALWLDWGGATARRLLRGEDGTYFALEGPADFRFERRDGARATALVVQPPAARGASPHRAERIE